MSSEFLTIRLGWKEHPDERAGYAEGMSTQEILEAGLKRWVLKASRAIECKKVLILHPELSILAARDIRGIVKSEEDPGRYEILGWHVDENGNPLDGREAAEEQELLGAKVLRGPSQNPIAYISPDRIA